VKRCKRGRNTRERDREIENEREREREKERERDRYCPHGHSRKNSFLRLVSCFVRNYD
jgi:hypothetical protein